MKGRGGVLEEGGGSGGEMGERGLEEACGLY